MVLRVGAEPEVSLAFENFVAQGPFSIGFLLGCSYENRHKIIHVAPVNQLTEDDEDKAKRSRVTVEECSGGSMEMDELNPGRTSSNSSLESDASAPSSTASNVQDVKVSLVAEQAVQFMRLLPGRFRILGLAVVSKANIIDAGNRKDIAKVSAILDAIRKAIETSCVSWSLDEGMDLSEWLLAAADSTTCRFKFVFGGSPFLDTYKPCDCKISNEPTKWHEFKTKVAVDWKFFIPSEIRDQSLFKQFRACLKPYVTEVKAARCLLDGCMRDNSDVIEPSSKNEKKKAFSSATVPFIQHNRSHRVDFLIDPACGDSKSDFIRYYDDSVGFMHIRGSIVSRAFGEGKITVERALSVRLKFRAHRVLSLALSGVSVALDMVVEDGDASDGGNLPHASCHVFFAVCLFRFCSLTEPASPRRGSECTTPKVLLSDYLFPGEGSEDACRSLSHVLGINLNEDHVISGSETVACEKIKMIERRTSELMKEVESAQGSEKGDASDACMIEDSIDERRQERGGEGRLACETVRFRQTALVGCVAILASLVLWMYGKIFAA
ncbi:unnamed protein product [Notodromas monacha]|uniref:Uncharacterized protein n=1 Tax=Notodromas monacha TaxID=399045 RepID=A0A7R9C0S3_9CRUS|nr:unnamed protein product [Notodromas monacha]CAG0923671.1 unnamed protein product [Notodromas monacha]